MTDPLIERMAQAIEAEVRRLRAIPRETRPQEDADFFASVARAALAALVPDGNTLEAAAKADYNDCQRNITPKQTWETLPEWQKESFRRGHRIAYPILLAAERQRVEA